ncbi:MAG: hypothetical protein ACI9X4_002419 [Glaciecola sp.]
MGNGFCARVARLAAIRIAVYSPRVEPTGKPLRVFESQRKKRGGKRVLVSSMIVSQRRTSVPWKFFCVYTREFLHKGYLHG